MMRPEGQMVRYPHREGGGKMSWVPRCLVTILAMVALAGCVAERDYEAVVGERDRLRAERDELKQQVDELQNGADRILASARQLADSGKYQEALAELQRLGERHPQAAQSPEAVAVRAQAEGLRDANLAAIEAAKVAEEQRASQATKAMRRRTDKVEGITWYEDSALPEVDIDDYFRLYFGKGDRLTALRLRLQYAADDWLFAHGFTVVADDKRFDFDQIDFTRDNASSTVWEECDIPVDARVWSMLEACLAAREVTVRVRGSDHVSDRTIPKRERDAMQRVIDAYRAMGGQTPS